MTNAFGWTPERSQGNWRHGSPCLRPFVSAAPWIAVGLLLVMFLLIGGTLVSEKGALFDLPDSGLADGEVTGPVALIVRIPHDTLVYFDASRYTLGDAASAAVLAENLSDVVAASSRKTVLALADRNISAGDLMKFAALARKSGVTKVLFAEKKAGTDE